MSDDPIQTDSVDPPQTEQPDTARWLPEGRSFRDEISQPRYAITIAVVLVILLLQIWVLF